MLDFEEELLACDRTLLKRVLEHYSAQSEREPVNPQDATEEPTPWTTRINDQGDGETLQRVHGQMIAHGLLKFQLDRHGMTYRISGEGRKFLDHLNRDLQSL